ncbi:hypothetical protein [Kitasatospora viridis]|uniref:Uncharacterized protein n=1 Tax=Kitasatospora viridis TaxID=281105 RepID=A0A561TWC1_9ACTN|nr:hypothetical protein [Kitasatospora viridis]TWF91402.1 hypothetical protein FHX73_12517 [Kitasatospora viridis]
MLLRGLFALVAAGYLIYTVLVLAASIGPLRRRLTARPGKKYSLLSFIPTWELFAQPRGVFDLDLWVVVSSEGRTSRRMYLTRRPWRWWSVIAWPQWRVIGPTRILGIRLVQVARALPPEEVRRSTCYRRLLAGVRYAIDHDPGITGSGPPPESFQFGIDVSHGFWAATGPRTVFVSEVTRWCP